MTERLYHEIACPSLTKTGQCNCTPVIVADYEHHPDVCGCENHAPWCPLNPQATEVQPYPWVLESKKP